jgi:hypothetical protein
MRRLLLILLTLVAVLGAAAGAAQAVVVDLGAAGHIGAALVPGTRGDLATAGISTVASSGPCSDPALSLDLVLPSTGLCSHGGAVMHANETFAITWDPIRSYWQTTRDYVEQFLRNVADASGTLGSPYAVTGQYTDSSGRAANASLYGGGCVDFGSPGGSTCQFGNGSGSGVGQNYPASPDCPVTGGSYSAANTTCLTDADVQHELTTMVTDTQLDGHAKSGYAPLLVLLTPPGAEVCVDAAGTLCSANSAAPARFCSYHSHVTVGGRDYAYVVQPWTPYTSCDEPNLPALPASPTAQQVSVDAGSRLVSPLSQGQIAAIVNPDLNSWFALDGSETSDNSCAPFGPPYDNVTVGGGSYVLQREFNNAGVIETDPNAPACALTVTMAPTFVVPSAVNQGDVVEFDGSTTVSSLIVPKAGYGWSFGDGTPYAVGPSVVHTYAKGGTYTVKLTVMDRGGNFASLSQTISVLGPTGQTVPVTTSKSKTKLRAKLALMPQGLRDVLRAGIATKVTSNERANGFVTLSIPRAVATRAHIKAGKSSSVVVGRGTVAGIKVGTVHLHLRLSRAVTKKLGHLHHVALTVKLALVAPSGDHITIDAAGRY